MVVPQQTAELSVTTFWAFLRELSPPWSHGRQPPHISGGLSDGFGVSGCRFEAKVAVFPSRSPRRAQVGG